MPNNINLLEKCTTVNYYIKRRAQIIIMIIVYLPGVPLCPWYSIPPNFDGDPTTQLVVGTAGYPADSTPPALDADMEDTHMNLAIEAKLSTCLLELLKLYGISIANPIPASVTP